MREATGRRSRTERERAVRLAAGLLLATLISAEVAAQSPDAPGGVSLLAGNITGRTHDTRDGLSHNVSFAIHQDRQGFLWVGTIDGLNRFDGREFQIFRHDPEDDRSLSNSTVRQIREADNGDLWLRTAVGLDRLERSSGTFRRYALRAHQLLLAPDGRTLVAADDGLYTYRPAEDTFERTLAFPIVGGSPSAGDPVWGLAVEPSGRLWVGTQAGRLFSLDPRGEARHYRSPWKQLIPVRASAGDPVMLGHSTGVGTFDPGSGTFAAAPGSASVNGVLSWYEGADGGVWLAGSGLHRLSAGRVEEIDIGATGPLATPVWGLLEDHEGALWIATPRGIRRLAPDARPFRVHRHRPGDEASLTSDSVVSLAVDSADRLWVGTLGGGLNLLDPATGQARHYPRRPGSGGVLCGSEIWALLSRPDGELWIGTEGGLCVLHEGEFSRVPLGGDPGAREPVVFALAADPSGSIWVGHATGLARIDPAGRSVRRIERLGRDRQGRVGVEGLLVDSAGAVWAGTSRSDLYRFDPSGRIDSFPLGDDARLQGSEGFWQLVERSDGRLWLASDRGLFGFDPASGDVTPQALDTRLASPAVYSIAPHGRYLWVGTSDGLLRAVVAEADAAPSVVRRYSVADGLSHPEFNRRAQSRFRDGRLAFGGMGGVTIFDPAEVRENPNPPPVVITSLERLRRDGAVEVDTYGKTSVRLAHDDTGLRLRFAALTFAGSERASHAYRLEPGDPEWVSAGPVREALYPALAPGRYRFTVRGANADGVWNEEGATIALVVPPPWWATVWFRGLAGGALLLTVVLVVRQLSTRRLRRRVRDLEVDRQVRLERERISRDLHDNIGSEVSTIIAGIEIAELEARSGGSDRLTGSLGALKEDARRTMVQLRETVWSLHQDRIPVSDLVDRIQELLRERQRVAEGVRLRAEAAGDVDLGLDSNQALQLYRVAQEAVSNALRHGRPTEVLVRVRVDPGGGVVLEVRDDGRFREPPADHRGFGLAGMRARATQIGAEFSLDASDDSGTCVRLELPTG